MARQALACSINVVEFSIEISIVFQPVVQIVRPNVFTGYFEAIHMVQVPFKFYTGPIQLESSILMV